MAANMKKVEDKLDELNGRLEHRTAELRQEAECMIGDIQHIGRAWVLPHPERNSPQIREMVTDPEIERIAVQFAIKHEEAEGRVVESVEADNRGFDLISRKPHPEDPKTAIDVRFIEVKGRAAHRRHRVDHKRIQHRQATSQRLLALRRFPLRHAQSVAEHLKRPLHSGLAAHRQGGALPANQDSVKHPVELKEDAPPYRTGGAA